MELRDTESMTSEEREAYIQELSVEIERLKPIVEANKKKEEQKFQDLQELMNEHSNNSVEFYGHRAMLANHDLFNLTDEQFEQIEKLMPILKMKMDISEEKLKNFKL